MEEYHAIFAERMIQHPADSVSAIQTILRCLLQLQNKHCTLQAEFWPADGYKKTRQSGFFTKLTTTGN